MEPIKDVYISCTPDDRIQAEELAAFLETSGLTCAVSPGDPSLARVMVLFFTDSVIDAPEILHDVTTAAESGRTIIPYRLTAADPSGSLGFFLKPLHWLNAYSMPAADAKAALADLCKAAIRPQTVRADDSGPEMALLRKKAQRRNRILLLTVALVAVVAVAAALLYKPDQGSPVRGMTNQEVFIEYCHTLQNAYGVNNYNGYRSDTGYAKFGVDLIDDASEEHLAVVLLFFAEGDSSDTTTALPEDTFYKVGITNLPDNDILTTPEEWRPYIGAMLMVIYPSMSQDEIDALIDELYDTSDGNRSINRGDYFFHYTNFDSVFLLEITQN